MFVRIDNLSIMLYLDTKISRMFNGNKMIVTAMKLANVKRFILEMEFYYI